MTAPSKVKVDFQPISGLRVLGLSGKSGSGKTWFADKLMRKYGWMPWAFAHHIKKDAMKSGDFNYEDIHYFKPPEARRYLQLAGTEFGRDVYGDDVWLRVTHAWLRTLREEAHVRNVVLTDVRFPNEARFIHALGGKLIRLEHAYGFPYLLNGSDEAHHRSETALDDWRAWDMVIQNGPDAFNEADIQVVLKKLGLLA